MEIGPAWNIIERVLRDELPAVAATLRGPAGIHNLDRLAETIGRDLPNELVASLQIHDGQDNPTGLLAVFNHQTLLSIDAMINDLEMRSNALGDELDADDYAWMTPDKVRTIPNCRGWLRYSVAEDAGWAVDLDPLPAGLVGQVIWLPIDGPTPEPEYPSYGAWLSGIAARFEAGAYRVDDRTGLWLEP